MIRQFQSTLLAIIALLALSSTVLAQTNSEQITQNAPASPTNVPTKIRKWRYSTAYVFYNRDKKYWSFSVEGKNYGLSDGLKLMGDLGYELVAVQTARQYGDTSAIESMYIFKQAVE